MNPTKSPYLIPAAILLAGIVLSVAIFMFRTGANPLEAAHGDVSAVRPVDANDHILGSPEAPVIVVEYSDIDCEYCKNFQQVMEQIMVDYGPSGKVAWVYRHFPLVNEHPNAATHAEASECVASLGSPELFWRFIDALAAAAPANGQFDPGGYGPVVESLGVSQSQFASCLAGDQYSKRIASDFENALATGGTGAPHTIVLVKGSDPITVSGYLPYDSMKKVIDTALSKVQ